MSANLVKFAVGEFAPCQFGNPEDTCGSRGAILEAKILASQERLGGEVFLVRAGNLVGLAAEVYRGEGCDISPDVQLYCTSAFGIDAEADPRFTIKTEQDAARYLGF